MHSVVANVTFLLVLIALGGVAIALILFIARAWPARDQAVQPLVDQGVPVRARPDPRSPYQRIPTLLTAAERDFCGVLQQAVPAGHQIFAQVRLANLVQVKPSARRNKAHWWRIQAKCVDFVLLDFATFAPRLVVELDDRSHDRADRRERDAFVDEVLAAVGIPILHIRWQRRYDAAMLAEQIVAALGIAMPAPEVATVAEASAATFWTPIRVEASAAVTPSAQPMQPAPRRRLCGQCQADLRDNARFCAQCGASFSVAP